MKNVLDCIYNYARGVHGVKTYGEFANMIGVKQETLSRWLSGKQAIPESRLHKINNLFGDVFSTDWLLTGEGEMLKQDAQADKTDAQVAATPKTTTTTARKRIPLYADVTSIGGFNDSIAEVDSTEHQVAEWIDAGDWFPEATAAIRHYGDSMVEYPAGSILVLKRVLDMRLLLNGRNYVIETSEFRVTKQLQYDAGNDYLTAYSTNLETYPDGRLVHSPIRIPLETIRHIDLIVGCVQKEFSNGAIPII